MEQYELIELGIEQNGRKEKLEFASAKLVIVTEMGSRLWYIDVDGIAQHQLLADFSTSEDIGVTLDGITVGGKSFSGYGFFHPNPQHQAAAIRGNGEISGF
ncbi:hypothetical protein ACFOQM_22040 [Paenibacillus sp. GCM10012307]|uniref:Uncharacterized protein n=1 Tax=Paenibacillus roseus TaxID=2798579 RepID=A0A934MX81_9BACL|nr:hypothetical protein [Paenibacillus roseus]MBJ6363912.1 hypothetical protein [Paenibacillus roseus]